MLRFKYCKTHLEDEEYMNKMSSMGWHTKSLVEDFWLFTKGQPNKYTYRIYYLRRMDKESIQYKIEELEKQNIEFVHKYSFWGIFRTSKDFKLYNNDQ